MPRVKGGTIHRARRKKVMKLAKGYFGSKHRLYKTAKEYKTDIASFGRLGLKDYLTWQDWVDSNWASNYQNTFFSVNVNSTIQSGQLFTKI